MKNKKIFIFILTLAAILRFYKLGDIPLSLDWDENSNAYNAYSILKTGRDEYGALFPLTNKSFDDYKPPMYMYLNVPAVAIFGLTPLAARLPSAIFGFLTVPAFYFLARRLFRDIDLKIQIASLHLDIPTLAMLLLAISPWHLQFSRVGFEATVGLFFAVTSITTFLYALERPRLLVVSAILLGLSSYTYHTQRIFVPLLFIAAFTIWKSDVLKLSKKTLFIFVTTTVLIGLPLVIFIPPKVILQRFEATTGRPKLEDIEKSIKFIHEDNNSKLSKYIHNRRVVIGQTYISNYLSHFDMNFLFTKGDDNMRHHIDNMGMLYIFELPLLILASYRLLKDKRKEFIFILIWLIIAPIAATPATPNPHGNRSLPMIIAFELISAYGLILLANSKTNFRKIIIYGFTFWIVLSFFVYLDNYWKHYPYDMASFWQFGYKEAAQETIKHKDEFNKIYVNGLEQAYIFWLFNTKYDPKTYQLSGSRNHFDKFYFDTKPEDPDSLLVAPADAFPRDFKIIKIINYPDGTPVIKVGFKEK